MTESERAFHEAAHFVCADEYGVEVPAVTVLPDPVLGSAGYCVFQDFGKLELLPAITIFAAGEIGQQFAPVEPDAVHIDRAVTENILAQLTTAFEPHFADHVKNFAEETARAWLKNSQAAESDRAKAATRVEREGITTGFGGLWELGCTRAYAILQARNALLHAVATELLVREVLYVDDLARLTLENGARSGGL